MTAPPQLGRRAVSPVSAVPAGHTVARIAVIGGSILAALVATVTAASPPPSWPVAPRPPAGAPNVLVVLTDDVGFGSSSTFGGPVPTPTFDALARNGARYNAFNTTAICSPTRASLLTGRYPHNVGMGNATNVPAGYPGYTSVIPGSAATIARMLRDQGYGTAIFGKSHITPEWESGPTGPFDRWPTGLGFDYFFGFLGADTSLYAPALVENTRFVERTVADAHYHFEADIADRAVAWIRGQKALAPDRPLFVYFATAGAHAPHHAPPEWLARFRGRFDAGWDAVRRETFARQHALGVVPRDAVLTARPDSLPAWDSLSPERRRLATRLMEAYAASLAFADAQVGRVVEALRAADPRNPPLVVYIQGDNGSSAEGGPGGLIYEQTQINGVSESPDWQLSQIERIGSGAAYNTYPAGWGWAMNTPFQWYKRVGSHFGGIRNGLVISWPGHIVAPEAVRGQFHHVSDIAPTLLEAIGVAPPATVDGVPQQPLDGVSMLYTFAQPRAAPRRRTQVFEMMENLAIYEDGWMASTTPFVVPWALASSARPPLDQRRWELYHVDRDFTQARDLAAREPGRLRALQQRFWDEAARQQILPIRGLNEGRAGMPDPAAGRTTFTFHRGQERIPELGGAPPVAGRSFTIEAEVTIPAGGGQGVIAAQGGRFGGYAFYLKSGVPAFHYNALGPWQYTVQASRPLTPGPHRLSVRVDPDSKEAGAGATVSLSIDGEVVATGRIDRSLRRISHTEGLDVGRDTLTPVSPDYPEGDNAFDGELDRVTWYLH